MPGNRSKPPTEIDGRACFSACGRYRYGLWRRWDDGPVVLFIMLNPATADASANDPTIRRCMGYAWDWGFAGLAVGNLFAFRTPSPKALKAAADPVGAENDDWLMELSHSAALIVAGWGNHGAWRGRDRIVRAVIPDMRILGLTRQGQPRHPLYGLRGLTPLLWPV